MCFVKNKVINVHEKTQKAKNKLEEYLKQDI